MDDTTTPRRRAGIQPLCPIHLKGMSGPTGETMELYSCQKPGCELHWRAASDYFRFFQEKPFRTFRQLQDQTLCSKPGHGHKFIAGRMGNKTVWECSVEGCSETEEKPLPLTSVWEQPKELSRSAANAAPAGGPQSMYDRATRSGVPLTRKRPGWVWAICVMYATGFVGIALSLYMIWSGAIPMNPQIKQALENLSTFDYVVTIVQPLLSLSAAVALFLLRRQATYLFWSSFAFAIGANLWQFALKGGMTAVDATPGASTRAIVGLAVNFAVCLYAENLRMEGTLR